jgi:hypothetical protein
MMGGEQLTVGQCVEACGCENDIIVEPIATQEQLNLIADV